MARAVKLHAIVFAWPGQGHINPTLRFSELLASEGCKVTFVHNEHNLDRLRQATAAAAVAAANHREGSTDQTNKDDEKMVRFVGIDDGLPPSHPRDLAALVQATDGHLQGRLTSAFEELVGRLLLLDRADAALALPAPYTSTFIVSDFFMSFTQNVANKFNIPRIAVYVQSASSFACHFLVSQGFCLLPEDHDHNMYWPQGVLPLTMKPREMISFLQCYDASDPIFDYMIRSFKHLNEPAWIVLNTYDELEHTVIDYLQKADTKIKLLHCGGPLLPLTNLTSTDNHNKYANESMWEEDHQCLKWLDSQAVCSVLFVSFGSLLTLSTCQVEEFALGLEASMVPFLWVLRPGMIEDGGLLPEGFAERVKERACFVSWAPQVRVLAHPSVGGFLSHCGWNSVIESIGAGVPLLGWCSFADQMLNARCIEDSWEVGLVLLEENEDVTRIQVEKRVRTLMKEMPPFMKSNCARLKKAASKAIENRNSSLILPLINSLKQIPHMPM